MEGGEDPGDLLGGVEGLCGQQAETKVQYDIRQAAVGIDGTEDPGQSEQRDVHQLKTEKQETATLPRRDLGRDALVSLSPINRRKRIVARFELQPSSVRTIYTSTEESLKCPRFDASRRGWRLLKQCA